MSSRLLLTCALVVTAGLMAGAVGVMFQAQDRQAGLAARLEVLQAQSGRIAELQRCTDALVTASDRTEVAATRQQLAEAVIAVDRGLRAIGEGGGTAGLPPLRDGEARDAFAVAVTSWTNVGPDLADLAAGEFTVFSARGREVLDTLGAEAPALRTALERTATALERGGARDTGRARLARRRRLPRRHPRGRPRPTSRRRDPRPPPGRRRPPTRRCAVLHRPPPETSATWTWRAPRWTAWPST